MNSSIALRNKDKIRNCSAICDFQRDREKNHGAKNGRNVSVIESDDARDGRSVQHDWRRMNHADYKCAVIRLKALQPNRNIFVMAWILM